VTEKSSRFIQIRNSDSSRADGSQKLATIDALGTLTCRLGPTVRRLVRGSHTKAHDSTHTAQIAIDGKTLRGSLDRFADQAAVQWISAFATDAKVVLGHVELSGGDKGGEIAAAQELIQTLGLTGKLFTFDALHCQKKR
jgi:hypothetical protein